MNEIDRVINYIRFCKENNIDAVITIDKNKSHVVLNALELSKKYEDTGLTPEQIKEIDKLCTEQAKELAKLKEIRAPKKPTNADYIKSLSDEDLAGTIDRIVTKTMIGECFSFCAYGKCKQCDEQCREGILGWLQQEREDKNE